MTSSSPGGAALLLALSTLLGSAACGGSSQPYPMMPDTVVTVDCTVPFVMDGNRMDDPAYTLHWTAGSCMTGTVRGLDLAGTGWRSGATRDTSQPTPSLVLLQDRGTGHALAGSTVEFAFDPLSAVTASSIWPTWSTYGTAGGVLRWTGGTTWCLEAIVASGTLTFSSASGLDQADGGAFAVAGTVTMVDPRNFTGACTVYDCCR